MELQYTTGECRECHQGRLVLNPKWLRERRERAGISLREFARSIGRSAPYISDIELGRRNCSVEILTRYTELKEK